MSYGIGYNVAVGKTTKAIAEWIRSVSRARAVALTHEEIELLADIAARIEAKEWAPPKRARR